MSPVCWKKWYGFTWIKLEAIFHTSSRSSMMQTMESPQGNNALRKERKSCLNDHFHLWKQLRTSNCPFCWLCLSTRPWTGCGARRTFHSRPGTVRSDARSSWHRTCRCATRNTAPFSSGTGMCLDEAVCGTRADWDTTGSDTRPSDCSERGHLSCGSAFGPNRPAERASCRPTTCPCPPGPVFAPIGGKLSTLAQSAPSEWKPRWVCPGKR